MYYQFLLPTQFTDVGHKDTSIHPSHFLLCLEEVWAVFHSGNTIYLNREGSFNRLTST